MFQRFKHSPISSKCSFHPLYFLPRAEAEMDERINCSTIQNLKELTDGKYEDLDKGEGSLTKGIFADKRVITDEVEVVYHAFLIFD